MEPKATSGNNSHITNGSTPSSPITTAPTTNPITVPTIARTAVVPVVSALVRSTDNAPSTTHSPF